MAKSFEEIMTEMNLAQSEYAELNELDSPSAVSVWNLIKNMFAMLYLTLQKNFDSFRDEIDNRIVSQQIGTLPWYVEMLKKFQYTDDIYVADNNVGYAVDDEAKKIVAQASASEVIVSGKAELVLKAVKEDASGDLVPLSINEKDALETYISKIKFAGVKTSLISSVADTIKLNMVVELNLLSINVDGTKPGEPTVYPVVEAIENYFKKLPFDGTLYWNKLIDELQAMDEVKDAVISESWSYSGGSYIPFTRLYNSYSGHLVLDPASVITYV